MKARLESFITVSALRCRN